MKKLNKEMVVLLEIREHEIDWGYGVKFNTLMRSLYSKHELSPEVITKCLNALRKKGFVHKRESNGLIPGTGSVQYNTDKEIRNYIEKVKRGLRK